MKKETIQDERVLAERRKINSEAFSIVMLVLLASILVQQFWLEAPFKQYAVEVICFFGMSVYLLVRNIMLGLNIYGEGKRLKNMLLVNSIVAGAGVTVINGILNYTKYAEHYRGGGIRFFMATLVITFISTALSAFVLLLGLDYLSRRKQEKILRQLDEDEQNK